MPYIFIASMDVDPDQEALFNEVYDTEHIPLILKVPGVISARRCTSVPLTMIMGGEKKTIVAEGEPKYSAVYELESAEVLTSDGLGEGGRRGTLAEPGAAVHPQPPARAEEADRLARHSILCSRCRCGRTRSSVTTYALKVREGVLDTNDGNGFSARSPTKTSTWFSLMAPPRSEAKK